MNGEKVGEGVDRAKEQQSHLDQGSSLDGVDVDSGGLVFEG